MLEKIFPKKESVKHPDSFENQQAMEILGAKNYSDLKQKLEQGLESGELTEETIQE